MPRRGENIYKRKDGRREGRYIKYKGLDQKTKYGYVYGASYADVKNKLNEKKSNPTIQTQSNNADKTVEQVSLLWLEEIKKQIKHSTYVKYYNTVHNHIIPSIGNHKISFVDTNLIRKFADEKLINGKLSGGALSSKTVKDILSVVRLILIYAENIGLNVNCNMDCIKIKANENNFQYFCRIKFFILWHIFHLLSCCHIVSYFHSVIIGNGKWSII